MFIQILLALLVWFGSGLICAGFIYSFKLSRFTDNKELSTVENNKNKQFHIFLSKEYFYTAIAAGPLSFIPILYRLEILYNGWRSPYFDHYE